MRIREGRTETAAYKGLGRGAGNSKEYCSILELELVTEQGSCHHPNVEGEEGESCVDRTSWEVL